MKTKLGERESQSPTPGSTPQERERGGRERVGKERAVPAAGGTHGWKPREIWGRDLVVLPSDERTLAGPQTKPRCSLKSPTMGEERGGRSCGITRELQKLKQQAMEYYRENDVPRKLEELLNSTFYLQPDDVYGHLVGTWDAHPPPSSPSPPAPRCGNALRLRQEPRMRGAAGPAVVVRRGRRRRENVATTPGPKGSPQRECWKGGSQSKKDCMQICSYGDSSEPGWLPCCLRGLAASVPSCPVVFFMQT